MSNVLEAAIFDIDGTLLDTREWIYQAYEHTIARHGLPIPNRVQIAEHMGKPLKHCYEIFTPTVDNELLRQAHREYQSANLSLITAYEGLSEMLDSLRGRIKIGAVTSRYGNVRLSLENAGIASYFDVIVQGDEVVTHKPHPEGILKALGALAVEPSRATMVGDSVEDILAGKAADVAITIAVTHGFGTTERLSQVQPDYMADHLSVIPALVLGK